MFDITLIAGKDHPELVVSLQKLHDRRVIVTIDDPNRKLLVSPASVELTPKRALIWDALLLDYGTDQAVEMLQSFNYVLTRDKHGQSEILEISNEPFIHTQESIEQIAEIFVKYAETHSQPYKLDRRSVVLRNFPVTYAHGITEVEMYADIRGTWSAFSADITLQGALKNTKDAPGIKLIREGSVMFLPIVNRWEENLVVGAELLEHKYIQLLQKALNRAALEHATLRDCDRIIGMCHGLCAKLDDKGLVADRAIMNHARIGAELFRYDTHLNEVYKMDELDGVFAHRNDVDVIKYFAPAHVCRADIIRFIVEFTILENVTVSARRMLNDLLFNKRHTALENRTDHKVWRT